MDDLAQSPSKTKGWLLLGVVFVLGLVCGAALFHVGQRSIRPTPPPGAPRGEPLARMSHQLGLDEEQRRAIRAIMDQQKVRLDTVLEETRAKIRDILEPEQQRRFDDLRPPRPLGAPPPGGHPPPRGAHPPPGGGPPPPRPEGASPPPREG